MGELMVVHGRLKHTVLGGNIRTKWASYWYTNIPSLCVQAMAGGKACLVDKHDLTTFELGEAGDLTSTVRRSPKNELFFVLCPSTIRAHNAWRRLIASIHPREFLLIVRATPLYLLCFLSYTTWW